MSEDTQPPSPVPPPPPLGKTQPVPLKNETKRITLRAKPGEGGEGGPSIPAPTTAPLRPAAPLPTVARPAAPPPPGGMGSRTIPLSAAPAPAAPSLSKAPGAPAAPAAGRPMTAPLAPAQGAPSPRPTVRLQPQQMGGAAAGSVSSSPLKPAMVDDDDEGGNEGGLALLAGIGLALAAVFLGVCALSSDTVQLGVSPDQANSGWKIPRPAPLNSEGRAREDYARKDAAGSWSSDLELPEIPQATTP